MFEMTKEQRDAWRRKVHSIDAALKSAIEPPAPPEHKDKPHHSLHLAPKLHLPHHPTHHGNTQAA